MPLSGSELVGARGRTLVGRLPAEKVAELWPRIASGVVKRGFVLEYRDLEPPRTGIFDGLRIVIDPDVGLEMQCFILLHLFGHSVQWVAPSIEQDLDALRHTADKSRFMQALRDYEFAAARFGLRLLHDLGVDDLDGWYSDFVATDWRYVERYYHEDRIPPWEECLVADAPPIAPAPIPPLVQRQVEVRFAF
ncbi:MAG: hypothetical protein SFU86_25990 [Pirellulaceae bacterium]|nr:hypothetical protein [Pirellulaceae bacterium]